MRHDRKQFDHWQKASATPHVQRPRQFQQGFGVWGGEEEPAEQETSRRGFLGGMALLLAGGGLGGGLALWPEDGNFELPGILPAASCDSPPLAVYAGLFDGTNIPFATPQQMNAIRTQLRTDLLPSINRGQRLEVFGLTSSPFAPAQRVLGACQPGRPDEAWSLFETGRNLEADYLVFEEQALKAFQTAEASVANPTQTPLIRGIAEVINSCRQRYGNVQLHLEVYSDCLQHEKEGPSVYVNRGRRDILAQGVSHPDIPTDPLPDTHIRFHVIHRAEGKTRHGKTFAEQQERMSLLLSDVYSGLSGNSVQILKIT